jgi:hypothetical protein
MRFVIESISFVISVVSRSDRLPLCFFSSNPNFIRQSIFFSSDLLKCVCVRHRHHAYSHFLSSPHSISFRSSLIIDMTATETYSIRHMPPAYRCSTKNETKRDEHLHLFFVVFCSLSRRPKETSESRRNKKFNDHH